MNATHQTSSSHQPALNLSDVAAQAPSVERMHQDMAIYLRRGHKARSEAFHAGFKYLGRATAKLGARAANAGDAIENWLFTPFYSGGGKS